MQKIVLIIIFLLICSPVFAASSNNYHISAEVIDLGGTTAESSNYGILGKVRPYKPIETTSLNYKLFGGFVNSVYTGATPEGYPVIVAIDPNIGYNDSTVSVEITGAYISTDATVKLTRSGQSDIHAYYVNIVSSAEIDCEFDLTYKAQGLWDVVVTNPGPKSATLADGFNILKPPDPDIVGEVLNDPNPFDPKEGPTRIKFNLSSPIVVKIYLFNMIGEMVWVKTVNGVRGENIVLWDGISDFNEGVPTGVYLCRIVATIGGSTKELGRFKIAVLRK